MLGQYSQALDDGLLALKITNLRNAPLAEAEREVGLAYLKTGDISRSFEYLQKSLVSYLSINDYNNAAMVYMNLGVANLNQGQMEVAEGLYIQALEHWKDLGNSNQQASVLNNLGILYSLCGYYRKAHRYINRAHLLSLHDFNLQKQAVIVASLGDIARDLHLTNLAISYYKESSGICEILHDKHILLYSKRLCNNFSVKVVR
jgi:tetratricopeptide (TPR) repeat protein